MKKNLHQVFLKKSQTFLPQPAENHLLFLPKGLFTPSGSGSVSVTTSGRVTLIYACVIQTKRQRQHPFKALTLTLPLPLDAWCELALSLYEFLQRCPLCLQRYQRNKYDNLSVDSCSLMLGIVLTKTTALTGHVTTTSA